MYVYYATGDGALDTVVDLDPALLAFVKCHVTSPLKWDVLRLLAERDGLWLSVEEVARATHRPTEDVALILEGLATEEVAERLEGPDGATAHFRVSRDEPSGLVVHRLIEATMESQELRGIIAAHLLRSQVGKTRAA